MWPDPIDDEDELMDAVAEAYSAPEWTLEELRRLLARGGRRKKRKASKTPKGAPALLRAFLAECGTRGSGAELCAGERFLYSDDELYEVLSIGNGDYWVCTPGDESQAHFVDHEDGHSLSEPLPLGTLLASWLLHDELVARDLAEHSDADLHASELCPVLPQSVFLQLVF